MTVLDASAALAFVLGEPGADRVEDALSAGARCGAANWSEIGQKVLMHGRDWTLVQALFDGYDLTVDPVTRADAGWAAARWRRGEGISLADRLCLALGARTGESVLTADREWAGFEGVTLIR
ncbi:MAG: PIN domain-containing protein [Desertimonas sp.]